MFDFHRKEATPRRCCCTIDQSELYCRHRFRSEDTLSRRSVCFIVKKSNLCYGALEQEDGLQCCDRRPCMLHACHSYHTSVHDATIRDELFGSVRPHSCRYERNGMTIIAL